MANSENTKIQSVQMFDDPFDMPVADTNVTVTTTTTVSSKKPFDRKAFAAGLMQKYFDSEVLKKAIELIPHKEVSATTGQPLNINNIFFLLKVSEDYGALIAKVYPYHSFKNANGVEIPGRAADHQLVDITKEILTAEGIEVTDEYLNTQLEKLNSQFGF